VKIDSNSPTSANVASGSYPFFSHEHCFTKAQPSVLVLSFLQYIRSGAFQAGALTSLGYLPLSTTTRLAAVDQ
jgi:phosphate transport system substrate-binding protein